MVVGYARCIYVIIEYIGMTIWRLLRWMLDGGGGVGLCQPLKG